MPRSLCAFLLCTIAGVVIWPLVAQEAAIIERVTAQQPPVKTEPAFFTGMGSHLREITTTSAKAQQFFNQGLIWMYAFNHDEAIRSFKHAAELDPDCAMAWWGVSLSAGPQYNHAVMTEERTATAWDAMQKALELIDNTSPVEQALIEALKHRNAKTEPEDRTLLNEAYAEAMAKIWQAHPNDPDVGTLYAEAMMVRRPWKLYSLAHEPHVDTPLIESTLQQVFEIAPNHPGALHLYIHAVEPSRTPERGVVAADRLSDLVPASGHLLHMPSHIYVKTGRWEKAIIQSEKAMQSDKQYRHFSPEQLTQHVYMTHNAHLLVYAAMMSGREQEAMVAARDMWANVDDGILRKLGPAIDRWMCSVYDVQKRFGRWDAILAEPPPPTFMPVTTATWRAARAVAYAAKHQFENAEQEHREFKLVMENMTEDTPWGRDIARRVLETSDHFIGGEIALQKRQWTKAIEHLTKAAAVEDTLSYGEPPQWLQPVRHTLGAVYLKSGNYADAERAYREDLAKWPNNGWSLYGLSRALEEQGKSAEAANVMKQHLASWAKADAPLATSCMCIPRT
jgi:tetratricopeptide (TPR) repeat protein